MYFKTFSVATTNIFPISNSKVGGQLLTEWNLRCRDMVGISQEIKYDVGPSFVHCADDFAISRVSDSAFEIAPGKGIINGHFVQNLAPMIIDLAEANAKLKADSLAPLSDELEVGLRVMYSTESTMAGAMLAEDNEVYMGIQVVVLPMGQLVVPIDSPTDLNKVNAHIKLGKLTYINGEITIGNNAEYDVNKCRYISADRIANVEKLLSTTFLSKSNLNPKELYVFGGKGTENGEDTWCAATGSLIVWDNDVETTNTDPGIPEATFSQADDTVMLILPHKHPDNYQMVDGNNRPVYYAPRTMTLPVASYANNTPGTVSAEYTSHIKDLHIKFDEIHQTVGGKQVAYLAVLDEENPLPSLNQNWEVGDYVLVGQDTYANEATDGVRAPSTMYAVLPGRVLTIRYATNSTSKDLPDTIVGTELSRITIDAKDSDAPSTSADPSTYPKFFEETDGIRGRIGEDYFVALYVNGDTCTRYYYTVATTDAKVYSDFILLTGSIPLAQKEVIGGFLNSDPTEHLDGGYVYRDETGMLRLLDYGLLRSGALAYQLGEDITLPSSITTAQVQDYLDEYVNQRVAFPNYTQQQKDNPNLVTVVITLPEEDDPATVNIYDIDSRFNTAVCLYFTGQANSNTVINIVDCEKVKIEIDPNMSTYPIVNVYRSNIYYDASIMNYIRQHRHADDSLTFTGMQDIKLWYMKYNDGDANLVVNDMTVRELDAPVVSGDIHFWNNEAKNDNHYRYALHSITFSGQGDITGCSMLVCNHSTNNLQTGKAIIKSTFSLPQGAGLTYPKACLTKRLKITGTFVSAYKGTADWVVTDTKFSALSEVYDVYTMSPTISGSITFYADTNMVTAGVGDAIDEWEPNSYHIFTGGAIT